MLAQAHTYPADWERPGSPRGADIWASIEELKSKLKMKASLVAKKMLVVHGDDKEELNLTERVEGTLYKDTGKRRGTGSWVGVI